MTKFVGSKFPSHGGVAKIQRIFDGVVYSTIIKFLQKTKPAYKNRFLNRKYSKK